MVLPRMSKATNMTVVENSDGGDVVTKFLADNPLFLGPDPEIMRNHGVGPRPRPNGRFWSEGSMFTPCITSADS